MGFDGNETATAGSTFLADGKVGHRPSSIYAYPLGGLRCHVDYGPSGRKDGVHTSGSADYVAYLPAGESHIDGASAGGCSVGYFILTQLKLLQKLMPYRLGCCFVIVFR